MSNFNQIFSNDIIALTERAFFNGGCFFGVSQVKNFIVKMCLHDKLKSHVI